MSDDESETNVRAMRSGLWEPEAVLRDALAACAEIRSRGKEPYIVLLVGEDQHLPAFGRSKLYDTDIAACLARLQLEVHERFKETYTKEVD